MQIINFNHSSWFEWDRGLCNRDRYILEELAKSDKVERVLSVDIFPYDFRTALRLFVKGKVYKKDENTVLKGCTYKINKRSEKLYSCTALCSSSIPKIAKKLGFTDATILNHNPFYTSYFKDFPNSPKFFEANDNWAKNTAFAKFKDKLTANYQTFKEKSDKIFTVSEVLKEGLFENRANVEWVPNGVDTEHFRNIKQIDKINDLISAAKKKFGPDGEKAKVVGYCGVLKKDRIDIELLEYSVRENPDKIFLITGPVFDEFGISALEKYQNFTLYNSFVMHDEKPLLYSSFDIGIMPHVTGEFIKSMDPIKLYEYLAAGKSVVTTPVTGTDKFKELIYVADTKEAFSEGIKKAATEQNPEILRQKRLELVEGRSWKKRIGEMIDSMENPS